MTHLPNETISQSSSVHISVDTSTQHKKSLQDIHEEEASMYIMQMQPQFFFLNVETYVINGSITEESNGQKRLWEKVADCTLRSQMLYVAQYGLFGLHMRKFRGNVSFEDKIMAIYSEEFLRLQEGKLC